MLPSKVMILCRSLSIGGAERQIINLAHGLQARGIDVTITCFYHDPHGFNTDKLNVIYLEKTGRYDIFGFIKKLIQTVKIQKPDILYSFLTIPNILNVLLKITAQTKAKCIVGVRASDMNWQNYGFISGLTDRIEIMLLPLADRIICNSNRGLQHLLSQNSKTISKTLVVPNGIDTSLYTNDLNTRTEFRKIWGVTDNTKVIALIARLDPIKNHKRFIDMAALVHKQNPKTFFVCIGGGTPDLKQHYLTYQENVVPGCFAWVDNVKKVPYAAFDLVCLTSDSEGFPNVLCEAMAAGVMCVSTDVGDARDIIGIDNVSSDMSPEKLSQCVIRALQIDVTPHHLQHHIESNFSISAMVDKTLNAFKDKPEKNIL